MRLVFILLLIRISGITSEPDFSYEEIYQQDFCGPLGLTVSRYFVNLHQNRCCYYHDWGYDGISFMTRWLSGRARLPKDELFWKCLQQGPGWLPKGVAMCLIVGTPSVIISNIEDKMDEAVEWTKDKFRKLWGFVRG